MREYYRIHELAQLFGLHCSFYNENFFMCCHYCCWRVCVCDLGDNKGKGQILGDREMSGTGVHDVKLTSNQ